MGEPCACQRAACVPDKGLKNCMLGLTLWVGKLSLHLWVLALILASPLPVQLPADDMGRAVEDSYCAWTPALM